MEKLKSKSRIPCSAFDVERLLEEYYDQLRTWGAILTRGDAAMAQEIVHDLCLHFTLARPDLSQVANLDGYLYTCLRHIYLSAVARASRETMQFVGIADFDSVQFALSARSSESLVDRQNELRRICAYAVWRKESSKTASCFILHFFHGYARREVAEIACLPVTAVYNKLKASRAEVKSHLETSGKIRLATREAQPEPQLTVSAVSSAELFNDLRHTIFEAKNSECLPEEALLANYQARIPKPVPCSLLSHIVSCERCLSMLGRHLNHPDQEDRQQPDSLWSASDGAASAARHEAEYKSMMRSVRLQRNRVYEHRPRTLSIAVNGRIAAFHDVQSERSTLASRIEHPEDVEFVEVFTDQHVRLALLPVGQHPPDGSHVHTQLVALSDGRWLELKLSFDGLGLHSEVTYVDPALAVGEQAEDAGEELFAAGIPHSPILLPDREIDRARAFIARIARFLDSLTPRRALAWTVLLAGLVGSVGYLAYRYKSESLDARAMLDDSVKMEAADLKGEAEHQVLELDATGADGKTLWQGTVDLWQDPGGGRNMRRLYDTQHRLIAAEWRIKDGRSGSYIEPGKTLSPRDREIAASSFWKRDMSARAFQALAATQMQIRAEGADYEITATGVVSGPAHILSAALILNHHLGFVGETLRVSDGSGIVEARFVQTREERVPSGSAPNSVFDPGDLDNPLRGETGLASPANRIVGDFAGLNVPLVQTQVAVLYRLNQIGADIGEPLEITRTADGRIRVSGTVADNAHKQQLVSALDTLPDRQLLEVRLASQSDLQIPYRVPHATTPSAFGTYNVAQATAPADALLRGYFAGKALTGAPANAAIAEFSRSALEHAQQSLQHAYALDRLGASFTPDELRAMSPDSQQQWAAMVARHASALQVELRALHAQLTQLVPFGSQLPGPGRDSTPIDTPANFARSARELLHQTQILNRAIGAAFSSGPAGGGTQNPSSLIAAAIQSIPLPGAEDLATFGSRLTDSTSTANHAQEQDLGRPR